MMERPSQTLEEKRGRNNVYYSERCVQAKSEKSIMILMMVYNATSPHHNVLHHFTYLVAIVGIKRLKITIHRNQKSNLLRLLFWFINNCDRLI
jgi:hypothetical protein